MAKSSKDNAKTPSLQNKAKEILQKKTGWDAVSITLVENRVTATGQVVYKYTGSHPKDKTLTASIIHVDKNGKEVAFQEVDTPKESIAVSRTQLLEKIEKAKDDRHRCERIANYVDDYLTKYCHNKFNELNHCNPNTPNAACTKNGGRRGKVDLVILIDTSGSMANEAKLVSDAAEVALQQLDCSTDLRITWLGIAGTFPETCFCTESYTYLTNLGCTTLVTPLPNTIKLDNCEDQEEGANTIIDLSNCFDWRPNACRAIFYISDEPIHQGMPHNTEDTVQTKKAIQVAQANGVTVFAHYLGKIRNPLVAQNYIDLCNETGGMAYIEATATKERYVEILNHAICNACGSCKTYNWQKIAPCFSISWGDSDCDCLETDDFEVLCITACNCYNNVTFEDVKIGCLYIVDENGHPVPNLPDGTPSIEIYPLGPICFGDIEPCQKNIPTCVSRQVVLRTRGAKKGKYSIRLKNICYKVSHTFATSDCFEFELCMD